MIHGGDIYTEGILKGRELLDYSSNINPLGVPKSFMNNFQEALKSLERYPDVQYREVLHSLSEYTGVDEQCFVLGNGAAEIIDLSISCFKSILIVVPSFAEYELNAKKWNCAIQYSYLTENLEYDYEDILTKLQQTEAVIIGNPNNPNGGLIDRAKFAEILEYCEENNKTILVDEAFIEFAGVERYSFQNYIKDSCKMYKSIFIIRALTKFFAMPGIRFGYGMCSNKELLNKIRCKQNPWNINSFAEHAVKQVLKDKEYIESSKRWIEEERAYFLEELRKIEFIDKVFETSSNFVLIRLKGIQGEELYRRCLDKGVAIRRAGNFKGLDESYVRLAIKDRSSNEAFIKLLSAL